MTHVAGQEGRPRKKITFSANLIITGTIVLVLLGMLGMAASKIINSKWNYEKTCTVESAHTQGGGGTGSPGTTQDDESVYVKTEECGDIVLKMHDGASGNREAAEALDHGGKFNFRIGYIQVYHFFGQELMSDSYSKS